MGHGPLIDRRSFVRAAGLGFITTLSPRAAMALSRADAVFASGFRAPDGSYGAALISERGEILSRIDLPDRAHGLTHSMPTGKTVAFARRPGHSLWRSTAMGNPRRSSSTPSTAGIFSATAISLPMAASSTPARTISRTIVA